MYTLALIVEVSGAFNKFSDIFFLYRHLKLKMKYAIAIYLMR